MTILLLDDTSEQNILNMLMENKIINTEQIQRELMNFPRGN